MKFRANLEEPMKCEVCGIEGPSKSTLLSQTWDWFTGYLPQTVHFCPEHRHSEEFRRLRAQSEIGPDPISTQSEINCCKLHRIAFSKHNCDIRRMIEAVAEDAAHISLVEKTHVL